MSEIVEHKNDSLNSRTFIVQEWTCSMGMKWWNFHARKMHSFDYDLIKILFHTSVILINYCDDDFLK
jgi:hypothetical protein